MAKDTPPRVVRGYRFTTIPEWVLFHPHLSALAVRIYGILDRRGQEPTHCFPSHNWIAEKAGISPRSVFRPLAELEAAGAIRSIHRGSRSGGRTSDAYWLAGDGPLPEVNALLSAETPGGVTARDRASYRASLRGSKRASEREEREPIEREPGKRKPPVVPLADFEIFDTEPLSFRDTTVDSPLSADLKNLLEADPSSLTIEEQRRQLRGG